MELKQAIQEFRKLEKRNFDQKVELIVNLKGIDMKRDNVNTVVKVPHRVKEKKIAGFFTKKYEFITSITPPDFSKFKEKNDLKKLVKNYDAFIAVAQVMPGVATAFGKALGPAGKMPSPQLGVLMQENEAKIKEEIEKINNSVKIKMKEPTIKLSVARESMKDEEIIENVLAVYNGLVSALPTKKENVKEILVKLTMSKPMKVEIK